MGFAAQFNGICERCDQPIIPGQSIQGAGVFTDGYVHVTCPKANPVCGTCFLTHPEGECDR